MLAQGTDKNAQDTFFETQVYIWTSV